VTATTPDPGGVIERRLREADVEMVVNRPHGRRTEDELLALLQGADGALVGNEPFTRRVLGGVDRLKVISRTGLEYETIDIEAATQKGIAVCLAPSVRHAVAEYAMALILQCGRKMVENLSEVRKGGWTHHMGRDLAGSTLGILGLGFFGREVAQRARAFEMRLLAHDPVEEDGPYAEEHQITYVSLEQLLRESDYVTLHLSLNAQTYHLLNADRLRLMKSTAYLINTARGAIVDTQALYQLLKERRIAGAALDVHEQEPLSPQSPFLELDNVYLSPHSSGWTHDAARGMVTEASENVIRVLRGERPICVANPKALKR